MARIAGVNLPLNKRTEIGLTYIFVPTIESVEPVHW